PARTFREFRYRTQTTWSRSRRVVGKAECLVGKDNPRFVVTSLPTKEWPKRALYEELYCARGDMENRIKEQQLDMFADRTSTGTMRGNQTRLWLSTLAYVLVATLRRVGLRETRMERAQCGTIRCRLLKLPTLLRSSVRRIVLSFSSVFPLQEIFALALARLRAWSPA
ncbi:MAG: transposase, partial [Candidatus Eisenbacteria bacterium]|nr:transposase [Candidatus Eisenbacteria bacterium]